MIEVGRPGGAREIEVPTQRGLPAVLPVLPLRDTVTFPETLVPLAVGQERSMALINDALGGDRMIAMVASRDPEIEAPSPEHLYDVGVAGVVARMLKVPDGTLRILVQATQRIRVTGFAQTEPYLLAQVEELPDISTTETPELIALVRNVQATFTNIVEQVPYLPEELHVAVANLDDPGALSHLIAGALRLERRRSRRCWRSATSPSGCGACRRFSRASWRSSRSARRSSRRSSPSSTERSASTSCASS